MCDDNDDDDNADDDDDDDNDALVNVLSILYRDTKKNKCGLHFMRA